MSLSEQLLTSEPRREIALDSLADYHEFPALNQTALRLFDHSRGGCPALAKHYLSNAHAVDPEVEEQESDAIRFNRNYHDFVLDRPHFDQRVAVLTDERKQELYEEAIAGGKSKARGFSKNLSTYQNWKTALEAEGHEAVDVGYMLRLQAMKGALLQDDDIRAAIELPGRSQASFYFGIPADRRNPGGEYIQCKARIDRLPDAGDTVLDLKKVRRANPEDYSKLVPKLGYDLQAAWYMKACHELGLRKNRFAWITQERSAPYLPALHFMPDMWMVFASVEVNSLFEKFSAALRTNHWGGYGCGDLPQPEWMLKAAANMA